MSKIILTSFLLIIAAGLAGQVCNQTGQTPSTAFPICGNGTITQANLPLCRNSNLYVPGCTDERTNYGDNNPVYYRFTCRTGGSFLFTLTPFVNTHDFDWQLFDITGRNPNDIFREKTLVVTGNWSGSYGATGTSVSGVNYIQCRSNPFIETKPTFSTPPQLQTGHEYLLLIAHADNLANGFALTIDGGTADITSTASPQIKAGASACDNTQVLITLNQKVKCSSIAADGSDFSLLPAAATITNVSGIDCSSSVTDSVLITFNSALPIAAYQLLIKNGSDGNTILNNCDNAITSGTVVPFSIVAFAAIDSILPVGCSPGRLILLFKKNIQCNSIATDGSDFTISGPSIAAISSAFAVCDNNTVTNRVEILLQQEIEKGGNYTVTIKNGSDGNTIIDACGQATPVAQSINFLVKDTVNADFNFIIKEGCIADTVLFLKDAANGVNDWQWTFDSQNKTPLQNPVIIYNSGGTKLAQLTVSNGTCTATSLHRFIIKEKMKAAFAAPLSVCPGEAVIFKDNSKNATTWLWNFDNGITSNLQNPIAIKYPATGTEKKYSVSLTVQNMNCTHVATQVISVAASCLIAVPTAFTPDGNGLNDYLEPLNITANSNKVFSIYNRYGRIVFKSSGVNIKWDGTINGIKQPTGLYNWILKYTNPVSGKPVLQKGNTLLIR
jgi:gliding motility-associated-like protein